MRPSRLAGLVAGALLASTLVHAAVPGELRRVLAGLQPEPRARLEAQARRWGGWTAAERTGFARRASEWDALPLDERRRRREAWAAWTALTAAERARLRRQAAYLEALPPASRERLREGFEALDGSARRGWMLGPTLGVDYGRLQPLLAQVPSAQHADLLRVLRAMSPLQRADLAVLVQRTPPAERARLRRELLSTSEANRAAWLQLSLDR